MDLFILYITEAITEQSSLQYAIRRSLQTITYFLFLFYFRFQTNFKNKSSELSRVLVVLLARPRNRVRSLELDDAITEEEIREANYTAVLQGNVQNQFVHSDVKFMGRHYQYRKFQHELLVVYKQK